MCTGCINIHAEKSSVAVRPECKQSAQMLRHVVLFKFKEGTTPEQIKEVENAFASLPDKIDVIKRFEWGTNVSPEDRAEGFTHCFVLSFLNEQDRDAYIVHPDHQALRQTFGPVIDKILVLDYWPK
jgi:hypothetical protein